jgi:hypothetical protein
MANVTPNRAIPNDELPNAGESNAEASNSEISNTEHHRADENSLSTGELTNAEQLIKEIPRGEHSFRGLPQEVLTEVLKMAVEAHVKENWSYITPLYIKESCDHVKADIPIHATSGRLCQRPNTGPCHCSYLPYGLLYASKKLRSDTLGILHSTGAIQIYRPVVYHISGFARSSTSPWGRFV